MITRTGRTTALAAAVIALMLGSSPERAWAAVTTTRIESGLSRPLFVTAPVADPRLFIVEQGGLILVRKNGAVLPVPFLDLSNELGGMISGNDERGLLGLAFAPDYAQSGEFYVNYTRLSDNRTFIRRYLVSGDPDVANPNNPDDVLTIQQPLSNHNGGSLVFGPDGFLYIGMGDGGGSNDPQNNGQRDDTLLGKMLRLDVSGGPGTTYTVPPSNPFVGPGDPLDEIWAKGLRNPYRFGIDRLTGDIYIGDVGQGDIEEVDVEPASDPGGRNYGWRIMEGSSCFNPDPCDQTGLILPVHDYTHGGNPFRCSVTGGNVYRGSIAEIHGHYFFADFCSGQIWSFVWDGANGFTNFQERTGELIPGMGSIADIAGFGEDGFGELYIVDRGSGSSNGEIFKIVSTGAVDGLISGKRLFVSDKDGDATKRTIVVISKDAGIVTPPIGSSGDPVANDAVLRILNPVTMEEDAFLLPGGGWKPLGKNPVGSKGYKYTDKTLANGPCRVVLVKPGRLLWGMCRGDQIQFSLDEASQGELALSLRLGFDVPYCMDFGGTVVKDVGAANDKVGRFKATGAPAPAVCPLP